MRVKLFSGIFGHFFLRAGVIQIVSGILLLAVILPVFNHFSAKMAAEQGRTFANSTLAATIDALYQNDYGVVVDYCMGVMKNTPNVRFIVFRNKSGEELMITPDKWSLEYKNTSPNQPQLVNSLTTDSVVQLWQTKGIKDLFVPRRTFEFSRPIIIGGGGWGVMTIGFSKEAYFLSVQSFYWTVTIFTVIACLLSFGLFYFTSRRVRNQIDNFGEIAHLLSEGKLTVHAPEQAIGEIGVLGKAINNMSASLKEKSERISELVKIVEQTNDAFVLFELSRGVVFANEAFNKITGYSVIRFTGASLNDLVGVLKITSREFLHVAAQAADGTAISQSYDVVIVRNDQSCIDVEIRFEVISDEVGVPQYTLMVISDISERKHAEIELSIAATAFESQEGIMVTDADNRILRVNKTFSDVTGYSADEVVGKSPEILQSGRHDGAFYASMWQSIQQHGAWEGEIWNRRKSGEVYPQRLTITAVKNESGVITHYVGTFADITAYKDAEDKIRSLAFFDPLTGLPNRRLLMDRLHQGLSSSIRSGRFGALLFIDLDNFKTLNDTLGHDIGDELLKQVAERLHACIRDDDTVARLGGDEFVVMLENLDGQSVDAAAQTEAVGNKILNAINQPFLLGKHEYGNSSSIGVTLFGSQTATVDDILKQADIAMYQAKQAGRNALRFFNPRMQEVISARVSLQAELTKAIEENQLQLYYQKQVNATGHTIGAEVLIRWAHPERGLLSPAQFIPLAEETDLIQAVGLWVLETACKQLEKWQAAPVTRDLTLSVNVSPRQFRSAEFVDKLRVLVNTYSIRPDKLKLELTESSLLENVEETIITMQQLSELGVQFALDDFGTGYSSLQYLKRLPLYQLKIDRSFVNDIVTDGSDLAIVRTILAMAFSLNLEVIAEGVETTEQQLLLNEIGCMQYQGYLFAKPVPLDEFEASL